MRNALPLLFYCVILIIAILGVMSVAKVTPSPLAVCRADPTVYCLTKLAMEEVLRAKEPSKQKSTVRELIRLGNYDQMLNLMNSIDQQRTNGDAGLSYAKNSLLGFKAFSEIKKNQDTSTTKMWIKNTESQSLPLEKGSEKTLSTFYFLGHRLLGGRSAGPVC